MNHEKFVASSTKLNISSFISVNLPKINKGLAIKFIHFIKNTPKKEVNIICKSTMAISADSVFFKQNF